MRKTYAYQYLNRPEETIEWEKRWTELDPEDDTPASVIEECREDIADREKAGGKDGDEHGSTGTDGESSAEEDSDTGRFIVFALQSKPAFDQARFWQDLKADWGLERSDEPDEDDDEHDDRLVFNIGNTMMTVALMPGRIPHEEAERAAGFNFFWKEGVEVARAHTAHILVAIINSDLDLIERGIVFNIGNTMMTVALMPGRIPHEEAERAAGFNFFWKEGVEVARAHTAHILVAIINSDLDLIERGKLFVKVVSSVLKQPCVTAVHLPGVVYSPEMYIEEAQSMRNDELPVSDWVWCGLERVENGVSCYTDGMKLFGKHEMEIFVRAEDLEKTDLSEAMQFMRNTIYYVLDNDVTFVDGDTIGVSETDVRVLKLSRGLVLSDEETFKIPL